MANKQKHNILARGIRGLLSYLSALNQPIIPETFIFLETPGTLRWKIGSRRINDITELKIGGKLNVDDISLLRRMASKRLHSLDLSEAEVLDVQLSSCDNNHTMHPFMFAHSKSLVRLILPQRTLKIDQNAFFDCTKLSEIILPEGVVAIEDRAFYGCYSLKSIDIPETVERIGSYAFAECRKLENVSLPDSLTHIMTSTFEGCRSITSIKIPDNITTISVKAFKGCNNIRTIKLSQNIKTIEHAAFEGCSKLTAIYVLSSNVPLTSHRAFKGCKKSCKVYVPKSTQNEYWLSEFGYFEKIEEF